MKPSYIEDLFEYNFRMNQTMIDQITACDQSQQMIKLLGHLLSAEKIWLMRIRGEDLSGQQIWPEFTLESSQELLRKNEQDYEVYFRTMLKKQINKKLRYKTTRGESFQTPVIDILMHVIIHSGYHRGQISALVRQAKVIPQNTDYIHYVRYQK